MWSFSKSNKPTWNTLFIKLLFYMKSIQIGFFFLSKNIIEDFKLTDSH